MVEKFGKRGFEVVGVTSEPKAPTQKYLEETGAMMAVAFEPGNESMTAYAFRGYPSAALVGPDGKVLWTGHPSGLTEKLIEESLAGVDLSAGRSRVLTIEAELPKKLAGVAKKLAQGDLGAAVLQLDDVVKKGGLPPEDEQAVASARAQVMTMLEEQSSGAEADLLEGRYADAEAALQLIIKHFKGHEASKIAKERLDGFAKDKAVSDELEAGRRIRKAQEQAEGGKVADALRTLETVIKGRLAATKEAARAQAVLTEIKSAKN